MAKKRHHSSHKKHGHGHMSAHHSSMREYRHEEMYAGKEMRDRMEYDASMMIHEDKNATANLPQMVIMKEYPGTPYAKGYVPDTIRSVDHQMREDSKHQKSGEYPEMY